MTTAYGACRILARVSQWGKTQVRHSLSLQLKTVSASLYHKQITPTLWETFIYLSRATVDILSPLAKINGILALPSYIC